MVDPPQLEPFGTKIPPELHQRLKVFCARTKRRVQDFTREAFEEKLAREDVSEQAPKKVVDFENRAGKHGRRR